MIGLIIGLGIFLALMVWGAGDCISNPELPDSPDDTGTPLLSSKYAYETVKVRK